MVPKNSINANNTQSPFYTPNRPSNVKMLEKNQVKSALTFPNPTTQEKNNKSNINENKQSDDKIVQQINNNNINNSYSMTQSGFFNSKNYETQYSVQSKNGNQVLFMKTGTNFMGKEKTENGNRSDHLNQTNKGIEQSQNSKTQKEDNLNQSRISQDVTQFQNQKNQGTIDFNNTNDKDSNQGKTTIKINQSKKQPKEQNFMQFANQTNLSLIFVWSLV